MICAFTSLDDTILAPNFKIERTRNEPGAFSGPAVNTEQVFADAERDMPQLGFLAQRS